MSFTDPMDIVPNNHTDHRKRMQLYEGWLHKRSPKRLLSIDAITVYQRRWFVLTQIGTEVLLTYSKKPLGTMLGRIRIADVEAISSIRATCFILQMRANSDGSSGRLYELKAPNLDEAKGWLAALKKVTLEMTAYQTKNAVHIGGQTPTEQGGSWIRQQQATKQSEHTDLSPHKNAYNINSAHIIVSSSGDDSARSESVQPNTSDGAKTVAACSGKSPLSRAIEHDAHLDTKFNSESFSSIETMRKESITDAILALTKR